MIATSLKQNRERAHKAAKRTELPRFAEGDFVLMGRYERFQEEKKVNQSSERFRFHCRGFTHRKYRRHSCLSLTLLLRRGDTDAILPHVLSFERGMQLRDSWELKITMGNVLFMSAGADYLILKIHWNL